MVLGNTYHLENRPGSELVARMGGLHAFTAWTHGMLTDSGGFQMVSLLHLADITEEGVTFQSPTDGRRMLLTPEHSIQVQNRLGADIIMALDDVVPSTAQDTARFEEATHRTTRWLDRCIAAHGRPTEQNLFAIVQVGGLRWAGLAWCCCGIPDWQLLPRLLALPGAGQGSAGQCRQWRRARAPAMAPGLGWGWTAG